MKLTHLNEAGEARMVDVGAKDSTNREAIAESTVIMNPTTLEKICAGTMPKGDVFATARIAGIMAAKKTCELIPLCHQIPLSAVEVKISPLPPDQVCIRASAHCRFQTGVEMEALVAASIAALTIYDMCKAVDRGMTVETTRLLFKSGGKSGVFSVEEGSNAKGPEN